MPRETKSAYLGTRVTKATMSAFYEKSERFGVPSDVLRELIDAFIENRLEIQPPPVTGKWKESLYVTRSED